MDLKELLGNMRRFCWRERSEKLNWRLLGALDVSDVVRRGDPAVLEPYALHVTFARLPTARDPTTRDAWFLVRLLQLSMEYLLFIRARDGDILEAISDELRQVERERDELVTRTQKWKTKARSGEKQVEKLHQVLQNIAKLLQIHGASPSAVATIETLLTELILERRARQRKRALEKENDSGNDQDEILRPLVQEARVCGYCGKLFSSAEYLEKHLVRRHAGEKLVLESPIKRKVKISPVHEQETAVARIQGGDPIASELAMQKMVQQVERALQGHEETLRTLAKEETHKVQQVYEQLHTESQLAEEIKATRLKSEQDLANSQRELEEVHLKKQNADEELANLKEQIQFLGLKKKMMGSMPSANLPTSISPSDDQSAAAEEIKNLKQTLEIVNTELEASRVELAKLQSAHLALLKEKQEAVDMPVVKPSEPLAVVQHESSTQTERPMATDEAMQTDDLIKSILDVRLTESPAPTCEDVGTDPMVVSFEDVGVQTTVALPSPSADAEVQSIIVDDPVPTPIEDAEPEPHLHKTSPVNSTSLAEAENVDENIDHPQSIAQKDEESIPNYIQQIHSQDLLDALMERANSAARKVLPRTDVAKTCSSISRHKFVRSYFQHDESMVKERVSSCLQQLEQFSRRFGVPAKSAWLSNDNLKLVQQALYGHLEVLPSEVLAKMVNCENTVNTMIEKEWVPMEKSRQQALERFKMEIHAKSEISQGLVRQAMATFGATLEPEHKSSTSKVEKVAMGNDDTVAATEEEPIGSVSNGDQYQDSVTIGNIIDQSELVPVRRYSAKNKLTVVVEGEVMTEGISYRTDEHASTIIAIEGNSALVADLTESETLVHTPDMQDEIELAKPMDRVHRDDAELRGSEKDMPIVSSLPTGRVISVEKSHREETQEAVNISADADTLEPSAPKELSTDQIEGNSTDMLPGKSDIDVHRVMKDNISWNSDNIVSNSAEFNAAVLSASAETKMILPHQDVVGSGISTEWHGEQKQQKEEYSQLQLPRVDFVEPTQLKLTEIEPTTLETINPLRSTGSFESDRLSAVSQISVSEPVAGLDRTRSVVASSEMSFDSSIPSLGTDSVAMEESTSTVTMGLVDLPDEREDEEAQQMSHASVPLSLDEQIEPAPMNNSSTRTIPAVEHDSVMSFDDSDIEEVLLT